MKILKLLSFCVMLITAMQAMAQNPIDQKEAEGLYNLGEKAFLHQDYIPCYQYTLNAAKAGYAPAYFRMGFLYENGLGTEKNIEEAVKWYFKSAESGNADAQLIMSKAATNGIGTVRDDQQALVWLMRSADQKNAEAEFYLGMAYFSGALVDKNLDKALEWLNRSAEQGYAQSQHNLGVLYYEGVYVSRDVKTALKWYTRAAENGYMLSQFILGVIYYEGIYADRDYEQALKWSLKAAEQGSPEAQYNVGLIYYMGYGLEPDPQKGLEWMRKSAAQDYKQAVDFMASVEKERTTKLDTATFHGLRKNLDKKDHESIRKKSLDCFYIEANISVNVSVEDLLPVKDRQKKQPSDRKSVEDMKKRLGQEPDNYNLRVNLADAYLNQNNSIEAARYFDEAESLLKNVLVRNPSDTSADFWLGYIHFKRDRFPEAVDDFTRYKEKNPDDDSYIIFMVMALMKTGEYEKMLALSQELIDKHPADANGYIIYELLTFMQLFSDTEKLLEETKGKSLDETMNLGFIAKAIQQYPDNFGLQLTYNAFRQLGFLLKVGPAISENKTYVFSEQEQADYKGLESFYLKALQRKDLPSTYVIHKYLCGLYLLGREFDKSIEHGREATGIKKTEGSTMYSNPSEVYDLLATVYLMKGDTAGAENIVLEKIGQSSDQYAAFSDYVLLARYQLHRNDTKGAEKSLKKAQELNASDKNAWLGWTCAYILSGNYTKASEALAKASMPCESEEYCKTLEGIIDTETGKYEQAFKAFKKAQIANAEFDTAEKILKTYFK